MDRQVSLIKICYTSCLSFLNFFDMFTILISNNIIIMVGPPPKFQVGDGFINEHEPGDENQGGHAEPQQMV